MSIWTIPTEWWEQERSKDITVQECMLELSGSAEQYIAGEKFWSWKAFFFVFFGTDHFWLD
jgi:hypothetical protein